MIYMTWLYLINSRYYKLFILEKGHILLRSIFVEIYEYYNNLAK